MTQLRKLLTEYHSHAATAAAPRLRAWARGACAGFHPPCPLEWQMRLMRRWRMRQSPPGSVACAARDIGSGSRRQRKRGVIAVTPPAGGRRPAGTRKTENLGAHPSPDRAGRLDRLPTTPLAALLPPCFGKVWSKQPLQGPPLPPATNKVGLKSCVSP